MYGGQAVASDSYFVNYAQFEDPMSFGNFESVTCAVRYDRDKDHADFVDVEVTNYYGSQ